MRCTCRSAASTAGYIGMRGKQGPDRDKYQGYTQDKKHTTKLFDEPQQAAGALATLKQNLALGLIDTDAEPWHRGI